MNKDQEFKTYNQINKLFKVTTMTIKEVLNNSSIQDNLCLVLLNKPHIDSRKRRKNKPKSTRDLLVEFMLKQEQFNKALLERLDKHEQLFRQHGWIK